MRRTCFIWLSIAAFCLLAPSVASAKDPAKEGKAYFHAGAQAFAAGDFLAAVQAFEQSYRLAPRPGLVFSIAQAYRRQYYVDRDKEHALSAVGYYRRYLAGVQKGGRRADAAQALAELEPLVGKEISSVPRAAIFRTRLLVSSSQTEDARISLDGSEPVPAPLIQAVKPGKHLVRISAKGYFEEQRELLAVEGALVAIDAPLKEKPARLSIVAEPGAEVVINGRPVGTLPLSAPIPVSPGHHFVTVTKNGFVAASQDVELLRDEDKTLRFDFNATAQRKVAHGLLLTSVAGIITGGVFSGLALHQESIARDIEDESKRHNIAEDRAAQHNRALSERDDFRRAAVVAFAASAAVGATGLILYLFDQPKVDAAPPRRERRTPGTPVPNETPVELTVTPGVGPGFACIGIHGRL